MSDAKLDLILMELQKLNGKNEQIERRLDRHEDMLIQLIKMVGETNKLLMSKK